MDAVLATPSRSLPAIPGGPCGDARFGLWLLALDRRQHTDAKTDNPSEPPSRPLHLRSVAAA
jgi:hypothetical protein